LLGSGLRRVGGLREPVNAYQVGDWRGELGGTLRTLLEWNVDDPLPDVARR
jgi:hypothetical protein